MDMEVTHLAAAAAVLPLESRGRSYLLDEEKMISLEIFTRLHARLPRLCDFDTVCDLQAWAVKNSEAASKRHATGLAKDGIAGPDGDDHSDGEEAGDISRGGAESGRPPMHAESAANTHAATVAATPNRKGKEKVGASGGGGNVEGRRAESGPSPVRPKVVASTPAVSTAATVPTSTAPNRKGKKKVGVSGVASEIPIFDVNVPEVPPDPSSDLIPRAGVVQYVVSSDEEVTEEPVLTEAPSAETLFLGLLLKDQIRWKIRRSLPFLRGANDFDASTIPQASATPPPATADRPGASFVGQPGPPSRKEPTEKSRSSRQDEATASGSGVAHEAPPVDPTEVGEEVETVSLSDFTAAEICIYIMNNNVGEDWEELKKRSCNRKMEFFFNCHSLLLSELANNYRRGNFLSKDVRRLQEQTSTLAAEKLSMEENHTQQLAQLRESADGHLSAQLAAEEKLGAAEEEIRLLREQLSASQESLAARFDTERLAEEAKEKAEREALDLRNQLTSQEVILNDLKAVLEVEAVDRFKRSPAYDELLLRKFEKGMRQAKKFFAMKDHSNDKALRRFDRSLQQHMADGVDSIKEQTKRWRAHCRYNRTEPHPMHLEIPSKRAFNTYYSGQKGSFSGSGAEPDLGPVAGRDYEPFMPEEDEEVIWPSEEEIEDEEDSEGPPAAG
ncbi:hypothetical protein LWI29_005832 [Acer saccharum]|uniref:Uncharacterized protein n=1 Tax=Acer saccharum TaxID=4024 RepID=A0AA39T055_ACESA|nr:hypothetical protein LWI29_005832 [Acer saccharum]